MNLEIAKMLTTSTSHITRKTAGLLNDICNYKVESDLIIYPKRDIRDYSGWFIYCNVGKPGLDVPKDLMQLMCFTSDSGCDWLCLDRDGEIINNKFFEIYEW